MITYEVLLSCRHKTERFQTLAEAQKFANFYRHSHNQILMAYWTLGKPHSPLTIELIQEWNQPDDQTGL